MESKEDEQHASCPLCTEDLDATDKNFRPCPCGYQICAWCWHQIMELAAKDNSGGRCPACRAEYKKEDINFQAPNPEELSKKSKKVRTPKPKAPNGTLSRKHLANVRVIQRNLVYVIGLSLNYCKDEVLKKSEYFGKHGKIIKVSVNRNGVYNSANGGTPTGSAYVTFFRGEDALKCITAVDGSTLDGKVLRACFGTTKYCNSFLKYQPCNNPDCLYLHDLGEDGDSFTKEEMVARYGSSKHQQFHVATHPGDFGEDGEPLEGSPESSVSPGMEQEYRSPGPQLPHQNPSVPGSTQSVMNSPPPMQISHGGFPMWTTGPSSDNVHQPSQPMLYDFQGAPLQVPQGFDSRFSHGVAGSNTDTTDFQPQSPQPQQTQHSPQAPRTPPHAHSVPAKHPFGSAHASHTSPDASFPDGLFSESVPLEALLSSTSTPPSPAPGIKASQPDPGLGSNSPVYSGGFSRGLYGGLDSSAAAAFNGFAGAASIPLPYQSRFGFAGQCDAFGIPSATNPSSSQSRFEFARSPADWRQDQYQCEGETQEQSSSQGTSSLFQSESFFRALLPNVSVSFNSNLSRDTWLQQPVDSSATAQTGAGGETLGQLTAPFSTLNLDQDVAQPQQQQGSGNTLRMQPPPPTSTGRTPPPGFAGGAANPGASAITTEHSGLIKPQQEPLRAPLSL